MTNLTLFAASSESASSDELAAGSTKNTEAMAGSMY